MPKLKYYNDTQRIEGKQIAMLEYQEKKRTELIKALGGKCSTCEQCDLATLILVKGTVLCANCRQKQRAYEAHNRLTARRTTLETSRLASWKQTL